MARQYLSYQESVKMLRDSLRHNFPGIKFSVAKSYQRGNSVRVSYQWGPPVAEVDRVAQRFHGRDFDGMTDSSSYPSTLLADADGNVREVHHGIDFVFVQRDDPAELEAATVAAFAETWEPRQWAAMPDYEHARIAYQALRRIETRPGETLERNAERAKAAYFDGAGV